MLKNMTLPFLICFGTLLSACGTPNLVLEGLPNSVFEAEPEYTGPLNTVGEVGNAYLTNTTALRAANNKLTTVCISAGRCEVQDEGAKNE